MPRSLIATLAHRYGPRPTVEQRRRFLKTSLAVGAGLLLSSGAPALARLGSTSRKRVVIIGAGFAGLACAHELKAAGYDVTLLDPRSRVGGRVLSFNAANANEFIKGRNIEGGAELIGSNHPTWVAYAERFKLEWLDVTEDEGEVAYPVVIDGQHLPDEQGAEVWAQMEEGLNLMNELAKDVPEDEPWKAPNAAKLDATSTAAWVKQLEIADIAKKGILINQTSDNGQDADKQSLLGQLAAVKGGGLEKFWTDSEVYRCKGGNDQLARALAEAIGNDRILLKLAARSITRKGDVLVVEATDGRTLECDDVVLAAPPPTWKTIEFSPGLPGAMKPQVGLNTKYLSHVKTRFWEGHSPKLSQYALSDGLIQQTWDGTDAQGPVDDTNAGACLIGFSGGPSVEKALAMTRDERDKALGGLLESFYPGYRDNLVATRYMDWPRDQHAGCSYSFPAPGQVTTVGPLMAMTHLVTRDGRGVHIAGEHACYKFVGYMEGGLNSGAAVARRLAARDGVAK